MAGSDKKSLLSGLALNILSVFSRDSMNWFHLMKNVVIGKGIVYNFIGRKAECGHKDREKSVGSDDGVLREERAVLRFAIVEDEELYARQMQEYLERYASEKGERIQVDWFADGEDIAIGYKANYDIILLDVKMQFMDGMTAAQYIRERDSQVVIIFVTNMTQYAIKGYEVDAMDYVLKPLNYFAFAQRLERAISRMQHRQEVYITVPIQGGFKKLAISSIYYVESQRHVLLYHTSDDLVTSSGTMKDIEEKLLPHHFFRCNKGYLVNLEHVTGMKDGCALVHGEELLVSRARKNSFLAALTEYIGEVMK